MGCEVRSVFSLTPCPVASCRLNLLINSTCCKVSQMLVHRSTTQLPLFQYISYTDILKQGLLLPYPQQHNPYAIPDTPLRYARWKWFIKSVPSRLHSKAKSYSRFLQCAHCRNECPCLHCGTHLWKKRTTTQATFINARSKDKSKGERKNAIVSCFGHIRCTKQLKTAFRT